MVAEQTNDCLRPTKHTEMAVVKAPRCFCCWDTTKLGQSITEYKDRLYALFSSSTISELKFRQLFRSATLCFTP